MGSGERGANGVLANERNAVVFLWAMRIGFAIECLISEPFGSAT